MAVTATSLLTAGCAVFETGGCTAGTVLPESLPDGRVGQEYFVQMDVEARGSSCEMPEYELLSGELPPGMKLSKDGALDGTPTEAGVFSFGVWVTVLTSTTGGALEAAQKSYDLTILSR